MRRAVPCMTALAARQQRQLPQQSAAAGQSGVVNRRIHHLYLLSGSGVLMGWPMPPPGPVGAASCCAPAPAPPPDGWPWSSRGREPLPEIVSVSSWPGCTFLASKVCRFGSWGTDWNPGPLYEMLLGSRNATLSVCINGCGLNVYDPED